MKRSWGAYVLADPLRFTAYMLVAFSICLPPAMGQSAAPALNITIVEGEGAINNVRQRAARETIVEITDENRKPVAGAVVIFTAPGSGPGGVFGSGSRILRVVSDQNGRAVAQGYRANSTPGEYNIEVEATHQGRQGRTLISQRNAKIAGAGAGFGLTKLLILSAVAGGVAVGTAVAVTRGGNDRTTITPGTPSVGVAR